MTLLIAVKSCRADLDRGCHDVIRGTWGQALRGKALVRFFIGHSGSDYFMAHPKADARAFSSDEVVVDAADDYQSLPHKTRAICAWSITKNVSHVFLCDTDTYVNASKLFSCGYENYDYTGKISKPLGVTFPYDAVDRNGVTEHIPFCYPWASGGYGYFLSRNAVFEVADNYPKTWAEDLWVGQVLGPEIARGNMTALDLRARSYSEHFPAAEYQQGYNPVFRWMETKHEENK
jgi:Galactosyltransferase